MQKELIHTRIRNRRQKSGYFVKCLDDVELSSPVDKYLIITFSPPSLIPFHPFRVTLLQFYFSSRLLTRYLSLWFIFIEFSCFSPLTLTRLQPQNLIGSNQFKTGWESPTRSYAMAAAPHHDWTLNKLENFRIVDSVYVCFGEWWEAKEWGGKSIGERWIPSQTK